MTNPSDKLTTQQLHILKIIYKFRFVTSDLVAKYRGVGANATNKAFQILRRRGLIDRRFDKKYMLQNKAARYYLAPNALKLLKSESGLNEQVLHTRYKDKTVGEPFIEHNIDIMAACLNIQAVYPDIFTFFTKSELANHDYLPQPLPDIYVRRNKPESDQPNEYFIDILNETQFFVLKKRIDQYIEHFESGGWGSERYPTILLICDNSRVDQKVLKYIETTLDNKYIDEKELRINAVKLTSLINPTLPPLQYLD